MANLKAFIKERGSSHHPKIVLQPTMHRGGLNDILDVIRFAIDVGADMVNLLRMNVQLVNGVLRPTPDEEKHIVKQARKAAKGTPVKIFFLNQKALPVKLASHNDRLCLRTLFQAYIDVHGNVAPCCVLRDLVMGNILDQSIDEIWRSDRFKKFFDEQEKYCHGCDAFFSIYHG